MTTALKTNIFTDGVATQLNNTSIRFRYKKHFLYNFPGVSYHSKSQLYVHGEGGQIPKYQEYHSSLFFSASSCAAARAAYFSFSSLNAAIKSSITHAELTRNSPIASLLSAVKCAAVPAAIPRS